MDQALTGLLHPLHGADHLIAMVAVGIWAVQFGTARGWPMPIAFAAAMPAGASLGLMATGPWIGTIEVGVGMSTVILAASCLTRPERGRALSVVAMAGLLRGFAHGTEAGAQTLPGALPFFAGMVVATLMLHLAGAAIGRLISARWLLLRARWLGLRGRWLAFRASWLAVRLAPPFFGGSLLVPQSVVAQGRTETQLEAVEVIGNYDNAVGTSDAASAGRINASLLGTRPSLRPAELLEYVPGMIVTQHSGDGKANQYFLRGFNLDHGTDFATSVDGMPVNLPTHAHGHGYMDLNFVVPELVDAIDYWKGPYRAASGDFSSAGAAATPAA